MVSISEKRARGINEASCSRGSDVITAAGIRVHVLCRKRFTDKKTIEIKKRQATAEVITKKNARLNEDKVCSATHCLFCDTFVKTQTKIRACESKNFRILRNYKKVL